MQKIFAVTLIMYSPDANEIEFISDYLCMKCNIYPNFYIIESKPQLLNHNGSKFQALLFKQRHVVL